MSDTLVFIPAWNEEANLPAVLDELREQLPDADVLVVDDGSTDRTADVARGRGAEVLSFGENRGLRAGIAAGWAWAPSTGTRTAAASTPTASTRPSELRRLLELVRPAPPTSRSARGSSAGRLRAVPLQAEGIRRLGTGLLRRSMKVALGRPFNDATSGLYAASAKALPVLARPYESGAPEVEALLRLHDEGLRVEEVAVDMRERASGESKLQGEGAHARRHGDRDVARSAALLGSPRGLGSSPSSATPPGAARESTRFAPPGSLLRRRPRATPTRFCSAAGRAAPAGRPRRR